MWPVGQAVKTAASHAANGSSILPRVTTYALLAQLVEQLTLNQRAQGSSPWKCTICSSLAQSVEHAAVNRRVVGSSPTGGAKKSASGNRFLLQSAQRPCALIAARAGGVQQSKTERTNKRRGAAVNCAGAERARWAMQRGGGGPGNREMCHGPVARGAARQFPGSEWSLVCSARELFPAGALFLLQSGNDPVRSQPQELTGCGKAKPNAQTNGAGRLLPLPEPGNQK